MKTPPIRWPLVMVLLALTFALAIPAQAARVRRVRAVGTVTFQTGSATRIAVGANHAASLGDLKIGDHVSVGYVQDSGSLVARRIADGVPHKLHAPKTTPGAASHHHSGTPGLLHAHGIISAMDVQAGTITITHK